MASYIAEGSFDRSVGLVGIPSVPRILGDRPVGKSGNNGTSAIVLENGKRYGRFAAENIGNGVVRAIAPVSGVTVEDIEARNVYRVIECDQGASINDFAIRRVRLYGAERGLGRFRGTSGGTMTKPSVIEFCEGDMGGEAYADDAFHMGLHFQDFCHDIVVSDTRMLNAYTPLVTGQYRQGDGFVTERDTLRIKFLRTTALFCTDGGYDLKGKEIVLEDATAISCRKSLRIWGQASAKTFISRTPTEAHICMQSIGSKLVIDKLIFESHKPGAPILLLDHLSGGTEITINSWQVIGTLPADQVIEKHNATGAVVRWVSGRPPGKIVR